MFSDLNVWDNLAEILSRALHVPENGKPVTIINLSSVPSQIVDVVVSLLCRAVFGFALSNTSRPSLLVLLVCEEAHGYIGADKARFGPTKTMMSRIAKEVHEYGVSPCRVSQRPSNLLLNILSQCNTLFVLRISKDPDQDFVRDAVPENGLGPLNALTALRTQEVVGEGVTMPIRIRFDDMKPEHQPRSGGVSFS